MLLLVTETFKSSNLRAIHERFARDGRMLPHDVIYHASWIDPERLRCFQLMEAPDISALTPWIHRWDDVMNFEVVPVIASADFWEEQASRWHSSPDATMRD
jgi:hypothetical protein